MSKCPICNSSNYKQILITETFSNRKISVVIKDYKIMKCGDCGEEISIDEEYNKIGKVLREIINYENERGN